VTKRRSWEGQDQLRRAAANFALQNCDFLFAIGVRLDFAITGYAPQNLAREAYKAAVDVDGGRNSAKLHPYLQQPVVAEREGNSWKSCCARRTRSN